MLTIHESKASITKRLCFIVYQYIFIDLNDFFFHDVCPMNNNPGALQTQATVPTLSATEHNEVIHKKLRILRGAGIWIFSILAGMGGFAFLVLMILEIVSHTPFGAMITINSPIHVGYLPLYPNVATV